MKTQRTVLMNTLLSAALMCASVVASAAAPEASTHAPPGARGPMMHGHGMQGPMMPTPFMHAVRQLNLSPEQKQSVQAIMAAQHEQAKASGSALHERMDALANPGDANYAAAIAAAKSEAANAIQRRSDAEVQIYSLLTTEQKAQLPKVLAEMKTRHEARREMHGHAPQGAMPPKLN